jgi:hypothetical protein
MMPYVGSPFAAEGSPEGLLETPHACTTSAPAQLRQRVLHRLMDADQQLVPFRFAIYAELAGTEIGPVT